MPGACAPSTCSDPVQPDSDRTSTGRDPPRHPSPRSSGACRLRWFVAVLGARLTPLLRRALGHLRLRGRGAPEPHVIKRWGLETKREEQRRRASYGAHPSSFHASCRPFCQLASCLPAWQRASCQRALRNASYQSSCLSFLRPCMPPAKGGAWYMYLNAPEVCCTTYMATYCGVSTKKMQGHPCLDLSNPHKDPEIFAG